MNIQRIPALALLALVQATSGAALAQAPGATLLQFDFNGANPWPQSSADVMPSTPVDVATSAEVKEAGTIDEAGSTKPSGALLLKTDVGEVGLPWSAT